MATTIMAITIMATTFVATAIMVTMVIAITATMAAAIKTATIVAAAIMVVAMALAATMVTTVLTAPAPHQGNAAAAMLSVVGRVDDSCLCIIGCVVHFLTVGFYMLCTWTIYLVALTLVDLTTTCSTLTQLCVAVNASACFYAVCRPVGWLLCDW